MVLLAACDGDGDGDTKSSFPERSQTTESAPPFPDERTEVVGAFWDGKIAVAGGLTPDESTDRFDVLDVSGGAWSSGPRLPHTYGHVSLAELDSRLCLVGG